jgi:hypothetical protein
MKTKLFTILFFLTVVAATAQHKTENVIIITLDGYRWQELFTGADPKLIRDKQYVEDTTELKSRFWASTPQQRRQILMPFFWTVIAKQGQLYGNRAFENKVNCSNYMWFSYPGYNEILTGSADDDRINSNDKIENPNITVLEFLNNKPDYKGKVAAFGSWDVFPYIINEKRSGIPVNAGFESETGSHLSERERFLNELQPQIPSPFGGVRLDGFTHHYALEYMKRNRPKVVYISYGETDDFAHGGKYDAYLKSAQQTDAFIGQIWNWTQTQPEYKGKTSILITTDHGRGTEPLDSWRSHGTKIAGADQIWFAVIGPDTEAKGEMKGNAQYYQNQVAKTAATLLGVDYSSQKKTGEAVKAMISAK